MSYHWTDVGILWAALEEDWETVDSVLYLYRVEGLLELAEACEAIVCKADKLVMERQEETTP